MTMKLLTWVVILTGILQAPKAVADSLSPAAVGWGNLLIPGLGATFEGHPGTGMLEAGIEIGLFVGGTFGAREGNFTIDNSVIIPQRGTLYNPLAGQAMQEIGLKLHFFDTFYHYQQACLSIADSDRERNNPQPLYKGTWKDVLAAPFRWDNLSDPWVFLPLMVGLGYFAYDYHTTPVPQSSTYRPRTGENMLYAFNSIGLIPAGSAFGEEVLFRGMIQREAHLYTGSLVVAMISQSLLFASIHPSTDRVASFFGGLYFGYLTTRYQGNLEQAIAMHFWFDLLSGIADYLRFRLQHGQGAPWSPNATFSFSVPL